MSKEATTFPIYEATVVNTIYKVCTPTEDGQVGEILRRIMSDKPLHAFLSKGARRDQEGWYVTGNVLAYDVVTGQLTIVGDIIKITDEDIKKHEVIRNKLLKDKRWKDEKWFLEQINSSSAFSPWSGFFNILRINSPDFWEHIVGMTRETPIHNNRVRLILGVYDIFMPFYRKVLQRGEN